MGVIASAVFRSGEIDERGQTGEDGAVLLGEGMLVLEPEKR